MFLFAFYSSDARLLLLPTQIHFQFLKLSLFLYNLQKAIFLNRSVITWIFVHVNTGVLAAWKQLHRLKQAYKGYIFIISSETSTSTHHHIFNINKLANFKLAVWPTKCWMKELCFDNTLFKLGCIPRNLRSNMYQKVISFLFHNLHWKEREREDYCSIVSWFSCEADLWA